MQPMHTHRRILGDAQRVQAQQRLKGVWGMQRQSQGVCSLGNAGGSSLLLTPDPVSERYVDDSLLFFVFLCTAMLTRLHNHTSWSHSAEHRSAHPSLPFPSLLSLHERRFCLHQCQVSPSRLWTVSFVNSSSMTSRGTMSSGPSTIETSPRRRRRSPTLIGKSTHSRPM